MPTIAFPRAGSLVSAASTEQGIDAYVDGLAILESRIHGFASPDPSPLDPSLGIDVSGQYQAAVELLAAEGATALVENLNVNEASIDFLYEDLVPASSLSDAARLFHVATSIKERHTDILSLARIASGQAATGSVSPADLDEPHADARDVFRMLGARFSPVQIVETLGITADATDEAIALLERNFGVDGIDTLELFARQTLPTAEIGITYPAHDSTIYRHVNSRGIGYLP